MPCSLGGNLAQRELVGLPRPENRGKRRSLFLFLLGRLSGLDSIAQRFNAVLNAGDLLSGRTAPLEQITLRLG
ncbi:hypothetical protein ALO39_200025 [Pseudomonas syringae pv. lapsa]|nr:hypothetical protein ALO39_200025 [Pseudomonas syringae pv. lapsa]